MLKRELLDKDVLKKLKQYGIEEKEYRVKLQKYHSQDKEGVPYRALIIKKDLPHAKQFELEMDIKNMDSSLCVIFKKQGRL